MTSGDLERALRDSLSRRAALTPPPDDRLADAAIRRGRVARRRRTGAGALAVLLFFSVGGVALVRFAPAESPGAPAFIAQEPPLPVPTDSATQAVAYDAPAAATLSGSVRQDRMAARTLPVDVVVGSKLLTAAGAAIDLTPVGEVRAAYRAGAGWLVLGSGLSLWYAVDGRAPERLLGGAESIVVGPGGDFVAWQDEGRIRLALLANGELVPEQDLAAPAGAAPVAFVGEGVLLARAGDSELAGSKADDAGVADYAVWWPGEPAPLRWRASTGVYGTLPDDRTVVAQVPGAAGDGPCLALLDALAGLAVRARACDLPLVEGAVGWLSPDGRWLVAEGAVDASVLIDVSNAFGDREPAMDAGPGPYGPGAWTDARTVVHGGEGHLVRLRLDRAAAGKPDAVEQIPVQGGGDQPVLAVPRLG